MKSLTLKGLPIIATALALTLSACGGGGGGSDNGGNNGGGSATLSGNAVKGIIKNGNVVAEELNADKTVKAQVGSATTGADGSYSLTLNSSYTSGPIQITISADANTEMKCDIPAGCGTSVNFGDWYNPGAGNLTMTALVGEAAANTTISVNVTPYTDLAARRAKQSSTLDASVVDIANSEVNHLLGGIDILNTKPLDITDPTAIANGSGAQKAYAAYAAAIGVLADNTSGSPDINGALDTLASSFSDGTILADDTGAESGKYSLQEIINGASSTLSQAGTTDTSGTLTALQDDVNSAGTGGSVDPEADPTAGATALAKVKAFVSDVRTWGTVIEAETKAKGDAFDAQASLASDAANMSGEFLVGPAFDAAIQAISDNFDGTQTGTDLTTYGLGFTGGTINNTNGTITITDGLNGDVTVNMTAQVPTDGTTASSFTIGISSATFRSDATDADINSGTVTLTTATPYTLDINAINAGTATEPDISGGSLSLDVSLTQKQDANGTALAATVTFEGTLGASLVNAIQDSTTGDYTWITPKTLSLSGGVSTSDGNSLDFSLSADITNADSFTPVGGLSVGTTKSNIVTWSYSGDTFTAKTPEETLTITRDSTSGAATITETWTDGYTYSYTMTGPYTSIDQAVAGSIGGTSFYWTVSYNYTYTIWVNGEGGYELDPNAVANMDLYSNGSLDGTLVDPDFVVEDSTHWLDATVGLSFHLQLAGLPEAYITISADRTAYQAGTGDITIAYGTRQIVVSGDFTDTTGTGTVTVTNQNGVTMIITSNDMANGPGYIKYNGTTYATVEKLTNGMTKITYTDNTFETL
jgi:hypothetical protein